MPFVRDALERYGEDAVLLYDLACFESLAGEPGPAFEHIARALELDPHLRSGAAVDSDFDTLRQDPRFQGLVS
jgi:hypothetical protein